MTCIFPCDEEFIFIARDARLILDLAEMSDPKQYFKRLWIGWQYVIFTLSFFSVWSLLNDLKPKIYCEYKHRMTRFSYVLWLGLGWAENLLIYKILLAKRYLFVAPCHPEPWLSPDWVLAQTRLRRGEGSLVLKLNYSSLGNKPLIHIIKSINSIEQTK